MAVGGIRRSGDVAGASIERALRALPTRTALRALNKSPTPKATTPTFSADPKIDSLSSSSFGMYSAMHNRQSTEKDGSKEEAVKVAIRIRPLADHNDPQRVEGRAWKASREKNSIVEILSTRKKSRFQTAHELEYDKVFGENSETIDIYNELVGEIVDSVANEGVNGTVFSYGQTGSGKTFTMRGVDNEIDGSIGIIQMAAKEIFVSIENERSKNPNSDCSVRVAYTEIYNEELRDLLNDNNRKSSTSLTIREDKHGSITVEGLKEVAVNSLEELMEVFRIGEANKSVGCTKMNDRSSRSHAILQITLQRKTTLGADDEKENDKCRSNGIVVTTTSTLNLVDLAGSESVRHTGASGIQKKEGGMINQSLLTLSKVLMALGKNNPGHINYRDSKLTRILKPSLSGNARMAVICCISPSDKYTEETKSTLQFATRAKLVKTSAISNEIIENESDVVAKLRLENIKTKMEIREKEKQLMEMAAKLQQSEFNGNPKTDTPTEMTQSICNNGKSILELESRLTTANDLVATLERQVDELSSQKNDALDWIEELFSKVELKENKIKEMLEEKNHATRKHDDLEVRLRNTVKLLEEATSKNANLQAGNEKAAEVILTMEAEIESMKSKVANETQATYKLEELYSEVAKVKEEYDIAQHTLRQVRADNEELRNDAESQISELMSEIEHLKFHQSAAVHGYDEMARENKELTNQMNDLEDTLRLVRANNEELRNDSQEEIDELMLEIKRLKSQQSANISDRDEIIRENEQLTRQMTDLEDSLRLVKKEKEEQSNNAELRINELMLEINRLKLGHNESYDNNHEQLTIENDELVKQLRGLQNAVEKDAEEKGAMSKRIDNYKKELSRCEQELANVKGAFSERSLLYGKISFLERENEKISKQLCLCQDVISKHAEEESAMMTQLELYEKDLSRCEVESKKVIEEKERVMNGLRAKVSQSMSTNKDLTKQIQLLKSEKLALVERSNASKEEIEKIEAQLKQAGANLLRAHEENVSLKERESELRGSVSRTKELVDTMKRRNDELEEENHSLRLRGEALEKDIRAASTAVEEQESAKVKLKTLAAEFEADYVMMRSKVDTLTKEKSGLEVRIAMLEAAKASYEYKSDRILERDNAIVGQHDRLKSDFKEQAKKVVYLQQQVTELSLALKRLDAEKKQLSEEELTLRETIKTLRMRLRTRNGPSPRPSFGGPGKNAKTMSAFFRSRQ